MSPRKKRSDAITEAPDGESTTKPKKVYKELYYKIPEDDIQELIRQAQMGNQKAQLQLLEVFSNFLSKYVTLIYNARYDLGNYDTRKFLALYVKDGRARIALLRNKLNSHTRKEVAEVIRGIQYMTQRYGDQEDVEQTVKMAFLTCLSTYKRKGDVPFSGFLYSYFFYVLKKNVDQLHIDQLGRKTFPLVSEVDLEDLSPDDEAPVGFTAPPAPAVDVLIFGEDIDDEWVSGSTAQHPFSILSVQERQLLKWRYVDEEKPSQISMRVTEHPNTIREHFVEIKAKIENELGYNNLKLYF